MRWQRLLMGAIAVARAVRCLGWQAVRQRVLVGSGCRAALAGPTLIGRGVRFGRDCGVAVVARQRGVTSGLEIGEYTSFQDRVRINVAYQVRIGVRCAVSWDVDILDTDFHHLIESDGSQAPNAAAVCIGDRVWIGTEAKILKGVVLGSDRVVAAGSVVTKSFQAGSLTVRVPVRRVRAIHGWRL